jgi:hypothetical protein
MIEETGFYCRYVVEMHEKSKVNGRTRRVGDSLFCPRCHHLFGFDLTPGQEVTCPGCSLNIKRGKVVGKSRGVFLVLTAPIVTNPWLRFKWWLQRELRIRI